MGVDHDNAVMGKDFFPVNRGFDPLQRTPAENCECTPPENDTSSTSTSSLEWKSLNESECERYKKRKNALSSI